MRTRNLQKKQKGGERQWYAPQKGKEEVTQWGEMPIITGFSFLEMWYSETPLMRGKRRQRG